VIWSEKAGEIRIDEGFLAFLRTRPCVLCGRGAPSDAAHVRNRKWRESTRDDYGAVPLCRECHSLQHNVGWALALERRRTTVAALVAAVVDQLIAYAGHEHQECGI
jgi:hypothetical protein